MRSVLHSLRLAVLLPALAGLCGGGGCAGAGSGGAGYGGEAPPLPEEYRELARGSLSAVEIRGHSLVTATETAESVYTGAGFTVRNRSVDMLVFERAGSRAQVAAYGNWLGGMDVRIRLRVQFTQPATDRILAVCRSYVVREAGALSEDEQPLARRKVREYEPLLYEVASRLN